MKDIIKKSDKLAEEMFPEDYCAKFGLVYDDEKSIELFRNNPIRRLRIISVKDLDNIDSLDWIFIIPTKDITKAQFEKLRQTPALKVVIASKRYKNLNKIANSYIEQELELQDIYNCVEKIISPITIPSLVGLDYADVKKIFADNKIMKMHSSLLKLKYDDFTKLILLMRDVISKMLEKNYQCNCFLVIEGGPDIHLDHISHISEIAAAGLDRKSNLVYAARIKEELTGTIKVTMFIGKQKVMFTKVIGCGKTGKEIVNYLSKEGLTGAELISLGTDTENLTTDLEKTTDKIIENENKKKGQHTSLRVNKKITQTDISLIKKIAKDCNIIFICVGIGGNTGTIFAQNVARIAQKEGAIVISVITYPLKNSNQYTDAKKDIQTLKKYSDTVIIIDLNEFNYSPNELLKEFYEFKIFEIFELAIGMAAYTIKGIVESRNCWYYLERINMADIKTIFSKNEYATVGDYFSETKNIKEVAKKVIEHSAVKFNPETVKNAFVYILGGPDLSINDTSQIRTDLSKVLNNANIILGAGRLSRLKDKILVYTVFVGIPFKT